MPSALLFGTVLPWMLIGVGTWLFYQLVRQNGRIILRLESIDRQLGQLPSPQQEKPAGLPIGSVAPDLELPDLGGTRHTLSALRGRDLLLIFFNPNCGFCTQMAADLAAISQECNDQRLVPVVITTGDADENRKFFEQHGIHCLVLLQKEMQVASRFHVAGTPMGYRIDGAGRIASELAIGAESLLQLAAGIESRPKEPKERANGKQKDPSLAKSRLNRNGLKAGAAAPDFRLPRLDGGELSLADFRGEQVLLVFSDPDCGPCDELAPHLQEIHAERSDLRVVLVSRRDTEVNRAKAAKLGLSFPIVLQKQWEISLKYAMFATPIGYLIDEQGILLSDVAVGVAPILSLADQSAKSVRADRSASHEHEPLSALGI